MYEHKRIITFTEPAEKTGRSYKEISGTIKKQGYLRNKTWASRGINKSRQPVKKKEKEQS